jgi:dCMP deaminase
MLYTTFSPCLLCAKMIINAGIKEVIFHARYSIDDVSSQLLAEAGVNLRPVKEDTEP